ncbi:MAG: type II 3-dehydroquinate dehydratase [Oscillospiraceae bacterium]|jgi:3-dehydroquinate dehydratase-2|nr:type II 3-dehydroquinate dehydratase [Oscillospiraceae bacterium]
MKILVLNGPNLNMLGLREPEVYGAQSYADLEQFIQAAALDADCAVEIRQTNHEGVLVDWIQQAYGAFDGIIINPAAYTHTSVAILDALKAVSLPTVEVHLSDISRREAFRGHSYVSAACLQTVKGQGFDGYRQALLALRAHIMGMREANLQ